MLQESTRNRDHDYDNVNVAPNGPNMRKCLGTVNELNAEQSCCVRHVFHELQIVLPYFAPWYAPGFYSESASVRWEVVVPLGRPCMCHQGARQQNDELAMMTMMVASTWPAAGSDGELRTGRRRVTTFLKSQVLLQKNQQKTIKNKASPRKTNKKYRNANFDNDWRMAPSRPGLSPQGLLMHPAFPHRHRRGKVFRGINLHCKDCTKTSGTKDRKSWPFRSFPGFLAHKATTKQM